VAPIGLPPWPLSRHPRYRALSALPQREDWKGLIVHRPRFLHVPGTGGRFDAGCEARAILPLLRQIRQTFTFDLIDAEFFFPDGPAAIRLGEKLGVPVSIKARGADIHFWGNNPATAAQVRHAGQQARGLLAVADALRDDMVALGMPKDRITVHHTGVDLNQFQPINRCATRAILDVKGPLIVSVGALIPRKGQAILIDALAHIPGATLVLIGKGEDQARLKQQADDAGLTDRVRFTGALPGEKIAQWLAAADVMALPSASEGLANAWVEALACGTPIVITDVGGAREVLRDEMAGRIVARDADSFATAIRDLIAHPPRAGAARAVAERFTWAANTQALYDHFKRIVGSNVA
jgi:teichuronic acid biosynthesis glycosyltransferase TuaC